MSKQTATVTTIDGTEYTVPVRLLAERDRLRVQADALIEANAAMRDTNMELIRQNVELQERYTKLCEPQPFVQSMPAAASNPMRGPDSTMRRLHIETAEENERLKAENTQLDLALDRSIDQITLLRTEKQTSIRNHKLRDV